MPKHRRLRAIVALAGLAASMFATQIASSPAAQARCAGLGNEVASQLIVVDDTYVTETPDTGTCNESNFYSSTFRSHFADWRASVWIQNDGLWSAHYGGYHTNSVTMFYSDDNSNSLIVYCVNNRAGTYMCGYHREVTITTEPTQTFFRNNYGF